MILGLLILSLTLSNNKDINESENVIRKKMNAFKIPIFIIREKGLAFLFSKNEINDRKRNAIVRRINRSLTNIYTRVPGTEMKSL